MPTRRSVLGGLAAAWLLPSLASAAPARRRPLGVVVLRGGLDGLAAVPPTGDPDYEAVRGGLAIPDAPPLEGPFGLHPSLVFLRERWAAGELAVLHAAATPYRERSHFDGQDVLETGAEATPVPSTGWLATALARRGGGGVAVGSTVPLVLRGEAPASSWSPSRLPDPEAELVEHLTALYAAEPELAADLAAWRRIAALAGPEADGRDPTVLARTAARFLAAPDGPEAAVMSATGWDTHAEQGAGDGALAGRLAELDRGLRAFRDELAEHWSCTAVLVLTEFGRTARPNGTRGTDHGTGAVAMLLGGAVRGGRVYGDWPGLARLHEGRDLPPANDLRAWIASTLAGHWGVEDVLPGASTRMDVVRQG